MVSQGRHFLFGLIEKALCYLQVGVKKAVHPIRFASDSRIALLAAVSNPPGSDRLPAQAGTILHKVQPAPAAAPLFASVAINAISDDRSRSVVSSSTWARDESRKHLQQRSEAHCLGLLTVYYFKTSSRGFPLRNPG